MSTFATTATSRIATARASTSASGLLARLRRWCGPASTNLAWTIGPDGLPFAQWIWPDDTDRG